uniref:Rho guanine nucleotide exchange factor 7 n=1 Tax=Hydra vulgaris TaxID=6087 RepID=T2MDY3_HYDVU
MSKTYADCLDDLIFLQAIYQFVGSCEDELSFNKGDVLVVTKKDSGGWWEGMIDGKIGWFPCNYGEEITADPLPTPDEVLPSTLSEDAKQYHKLVVENILQIQKKHLTELKDFWEHYLLPLKSSEILNEQKREIICGNYDEIVSFQVELSQKLEQQSLKPIEKQRFGECFLLVRMQMKSLYLQYCLNHPQAAIIISQNADELSAYMESKGAQKPGIMFLRSLLSKPFLHVEKYGNQIKELERHVEECNIDSLDMKKATQVLQIIALSCHEVRKKKETELEILTGTIEGWQGEHITSLGTLVHMGQVFIEKEELARRERYFCLFPNDFVVVSVGIDLVGYCFEERHSVVGISARNIEDTDTFFNGFELIVSNNKWRVMTSSPREKDVWMHALKKVLKDRCDLAIQPETPKLAASKLERSDSKRSEVKSLPLSDEGVEIDEKPILRSYSTGAAVGSYKASDTVVNTVSSVEPYKANAVSAIKATARQPVKKEWSFTRLRPTPPYQQSSQTKIEDQQSSSPISIRRIVSSKKMVGGRGSREDLVDSVVRKQSTPAALITPTQVLEEDMMILSVIEAYCFSARQRQNVTCSPESSFLLPDVPPHFSFKPITPPRTNYPMKQKYLKKSKKKPKEIDGNAELFGLKEQVQNLHKQTLYLRENLEEERKSRENFEKYLKRIFKRIAPDIDLSEEKAPQKITPL